MSNVRSCPSSSSSSCASDQPNGGKFLSLRGPRTGTAAAGSTL